MKQNEKSVTSTKQKRANVSSSDQSVTYQLMNKSIQYVIPTLYIIPCATKYSFPERLLNSKQTKLFKFKKTLVLIQFLSK